MALLVDYRRGSGEFEKGLRKMGLPAKRATLPFADFAFKGYGPGTIIPVGIERKTVDEIIGHVSYKRFKGHQLPGLVKRYGHHAWLIIEGRVTVDPRSGLVMAGQWEGGFSNRLMFDVYIKRRMTLMTKAALHVIPTNTKTETLWAVFAIYSWYQKPWKSHKSAFDVDERVADHAILDERTLRRQVLAQFPNIGWTRSKQVSKYFDSIADAVNATEEQWMDALGIREGRTIARNLVRALHGKHLKDGAKGA